MNAPVDPASLQRRPHSFTIDDVRAMVAAGDETAAALLLPSLSLRLADLARVS